MAVGLLVLAACAQDMRAGDGEVVADEAVYPGAVGPVVAEVAHTDAHAARLWEVVGFTDQAPGLDGAAMVVVAGAEDAGCPWDLTDVTADRTAVTVTLGRPDAPLDCTNEWNARSLALLVPDEHLTDDAEVVVVHPWGATENPGPIPSTPAHWLEAVLRTEDFTDAHGCGDVITYASTPDETVAVIVRWDGAASRALAAGRTDDDVAMPHADVQVELLLGGYLREGLCTDVVQLGRPLVKERLPAVSGTARIAVEPQHGADEHMPLAVATVTLHEVVFEAGGDDTASGQVEQLELRDVEVGWIPG